MYTARRIGSGSEQSGPDFFEVTMAKIMQMNPIPRGVCIGERVDRRVSEPEHYFKCPLCGGYFDGRDKGWFDEHQEPLPHPASDQPQ
jgi:hypothetical protein